MGPSAIPAQLRAASTPGPAGTSSRVIPGTRLGRRLDTWASRQLAAPRLRPRCVLRLAQRALTKLPLVVYCMNNGGECAANSKLPPFTRATASPARLRSSASMIGRLPVQLDHARRQLTRARRLAASIAGSTAPRSTSGPLRSTACSTGRRHAPGTLDSSPARSASFTRGLLDHPGQLRSSSISSPARQLQRCPKGPR